MLDSDPITSGNPSYYLLTDADFDSLEGDLSVDGLLPKRDWFAYNGGSFDADNKSHKKSLFFDITFSLIWVDYRNERKGSAEDWKLDQHCC